MSRGERWQQSSAGSTQLSAKVPESLKEDFREASEQRGETMTDVIKSKMIEVVEAELGAGSGDPLPDDPALADAYRALRKNANPDSNLLNTRIAESVAAEASGVKSRVVRENVLEPLRSRGFIRPYFGQIVVIPPEESGDE